MSDRGLNALIWLARVGLYLGLFVGVGGVFFARWVAWSMTGMTVPRVALAIGIPSAAASRRRVGPRSPRAAASGSRDGRPLEGRVRDQRRPRAAGCDRCDAARVDGAAQRMVCARPCDHRARRRRSVACHDRARRNGPAGGVDPAGDLSPRPRRHHLDRCSRAAGRAGVEADDCDAPRREPLFPHRCAGGRRAGLDRPRTRDRSARKAGRRWSRPATDSSSRSSLHWSRDCWRLPRSIGSG